MRSILKQKETNYDKAEQLRLELEVYLVCRSPLCFMLNNQTLKVELKFYHGVPNMVVLFRDDSLILAV